MNKKKLVKRLIVISTSATLVFSLGGIVYASAQALPNGTIVNQSGAKYLSNSKGEKYSGWFIDSKDNWYYFNKSDKVMKTGWHQDDKDGYFYYLNLADGKMTTGWNAIDGKEYFFQPVRDMGNYHFNSEEEKWLYSINSKVPYGGLYLNTTTPDGSTVDGTGAKIIKSKIPIDKVEASHLVKDGWVLESGKWYYYIDGIMKKDQWLNLDGKWYYVLLDGTMFSNGWQEIGGKSYYFGADGAIYINTTTPDGKQVGNDGSFSSNDSRQNINYSDFVGIYSTKTLNDLGFQGNNWENDISISSELDSEGVLTIDRITDNHIYGYYHQADDVSNDYQKSNFESGLIIENDVFYMNVYFEEGGGHAGSNEFNLINDDFKIKCQFSYENGKPVIILNGASNVMYPSSGERIVDYKNKILKKIK